MYASSTITGILCMARQTLTGAREWLFEQRQPTRYIGNAHSLPPFGGGADLSAKAALGCSAGLQYSGLDTRNAFGENAQIGSLARTLSLLAMPLLVFELNTLQRPFVSILHYPTENRSYSAEAI